MAKKQTVTNENKILCKDCEFSFDPDWSNLGADSKLPILCSCKHSKFKVFYNIIEKKCINSKQKK